MCQIRKPGTLLRHHEDLQMFAPPAIRVSSGPSTGMLTRLYLPPLRLLGNAPSMSCMIAKYGDPVRVVCADVQCSQYADLAVSEASVSSLFAPASIPSSVKWSQRDT
ncbi:hypothetical protein SCLCIDRAFT_34498 [Scleroderma citrinum Foug A]|uniref:Uncharacterized protein n=1 Tax=Scleroderma citrinum Foug A TaxID=1036808 RepID=A0A0C2ZAX0_9AGAM|nr:hypothetical protein SCLCIDRAFT_34498 [Scleroderma citrinum Foug A]